MDIEARLRQLESHYRAALSATVAAKASYLALAGEPSTLPAAVRRAAVRWQQLDLSKQTVVAEMGKLEELDFGFIWIHDLRLEATLPVNPRKTCRRPQRRPSTGHRQAYRPQQMTIEVSKDE